MPEPRSYTPAYRALPDLRWETADPDYLVFNPLSDEIHRLDPVAAAALAELENAALTADTLRQRVASLFEKHEDSKFEQQVEQILLQFDDIGLVFPMSQPSMKDGR